MPESFIKTNATANRNVYISIFKFYQIFRVSIIFSLHTCILHSVQNGFAEFCVALFIIQISLALCAQCTYFAMLKWNFGKSNNIAQKYKVGGLHSEAKLPRNAQHTQHMPFWFESFSILKVPMKKWVQAQHILAQIEISAHRFVVEFVELGRHWKIMRIWHSRK